MRLNWEVRRRFRTVLVLIVLAAFACSQSAAAMVEHHHSHGKASSHCCSSCHTGHLGVVQGDSHVRLDAPSAVYGRQAIDESCAPADALIVHNESRAPPA
ncbi:MAG: hypothetical protein U0Q18_12625 [Bryobacteraceae bacterium]